MRGRTTEETERGRWRHDSKVSSEGDRGERPGYGQGERDDTSEGWSGRSEGGLAEETEETEEYRMTVGVPEGSGDTLMASPWGTQESGTGVLQGGTRSGGSDTRKSPSAATREAGTRGCHGARPGQGEKNGGRREMREA